jgi:protein-S-isoprenylcysteine O-methyltransferase Ste14
MTFFETFMHVAFAAIFLVAALGTLGVLITHMMLFGASFESNKYPLLIVVLTALSAFVCAVLLVWGWSNGNRFETWWDSLSAHKQTQSVVILPEKQ